MSRGQATLEQFESTPPRGYRQCEAVAEYTEERCQRRALDGVPYCTLHLGNLETTPENKREAF